MKSEIHNEYEKTFLQLVVALTKCGSVEEVMSFGQLVNGFKQIDAPSELTDYLQDSIKNKLETLKKRDNLDFTKLRAFTK